MNHTTKILISLALLAVIAGGVWYARKGAPETPPADSGVGQVVDSLDDSAVDDGVQEGGVDTSDWKIYQNNKLGIEFRYPKNWDLDDIQKNNEIVSVSNYFTNKFGDQDGSKIWIVIEENKYNSFEEWREQSFDIFKDETVEKNTNFDFQGLSANLVKSTSPIAGGYNNRLAAFNQQKNLIYIVWSHRRIRTELQKENDAHEKIIDQVIKSLKINQ